MKRIILLSMFIFSILLSSCSKEISRAEAEKLAFSRFNEYVIEKKISPAQFEHTRTTFVVQADAWEILFESKNEPKKIIGITVGRYGGAELHSDLDTSTP